MQLLQLGVSSVRNLGKQNIYFPSGVSILVGANGQGKTSILEAIHILSITRSFRTNTLRDVICRVSHEDTLERPIGFEISGLIRDSLSNENSLSIRFNAADSRRSFWIDSNPVPSAKHFLGRFPVVCFSPEDAEIVSGPPQIRRNFVDRVLALTDADFIDETLSYHKVLRSRNALLAGKDERGKSFAIELDLLTEMLAGYANKIATKRQSILVEIYSFFLPIYESIVSNDFAVKERVNFNYIGESIRDVMSVLSKEDIYLLMKRNTERDLRYRTTTIGPHRDDIDISFSSRTEDTKDILQARKSASRGQLRSIALAMKLATVELLYNKTGERPLILLDDLESELDMERRRSLYSLIHSYPCQLIITSTEVPKHISSIVDNYSVIRVKGGYVES